MPVHDFEGRIAAGARNRSRLIHEELERRAANFNAEPEGPIVMRSVCQDQGFVCQVINGAQAYYCTVCGWVYR